MALSFERAKLVCWDKTKPKREPGKGGLRKISLRN
jgi:hypothetical protein